jgi:hypothetical protein
MSFFASDWLQSALTPQGAHNAMGRDERNSTVQGGWADLFKQYQPIAQNQINFAKTLQPQYQSSIMGGINSLNDQGVNANIRAFGANAQENAARNAMQNQSSLAGMGLGREAQAGSLLGSMNQAQAATNQYAQQMQSPQAKAQRYQQIMEMLAQGMNPSMILQSLGAMSAGVYGQPSPYVGQSAGETLGQIAGAYSASQGAKKK